MKIRFKLFIPLIVILFFYLLFVARIIKRDGGIKEIVGRFEKTGDLDTAKAYSFLTVGWQEVLYSIKNTSEFRQNTKHDEGMYAIHSFTDMVNDSEIFHFILLRDDQFKWKNSPFSDKLDIFNRQLLNYFIYCIPQKSYSTGWQTFLAKRNKIKSGLYSLSVFLPLKTIECKLPYRKPLITISNEIQPGYMLQEFSVANGKKLVLMNFNLYEKGYVTNVQWEKVASDAFQLTKNGDYVIVSGSIVGKYADKDEKSMQVEGMERIEKKNRNILTSIHEYIFYSPNLMVEEVKLRKNNNDMNIVSYQFRFKQ